MYELGVVYRNIERTPGHLAYALAPFGSATVHEAIGRRGYLGVDHSICSLNAGRRRGLLRLRLGRTASHRLAI